MNQVQRKFLITIVIIVTGCNTGDTVFDSETVKSKSYITSNGLLGGETAMPSGICRYIIRKNGGISWDKWEYEIQDKDTRWKVGDTIWVNKTKAK